MNKMLQHRRQFLLTKAPVKPLADWKCLRIGEYHLYAHPDLEVNYSEDGQKSILVIGNIYDSEEPHKGNAQILKDIVATSSSMGRLVSWVKRYAGRYALLYIDQKDAVMLPDALALREIYYCISNNIVVCGSQPNLVAKFSNPEVSTTSNVKLLEFFSKHSKDSKWDPAYKWIGDETYYQDVKHLLPNYFLDIPKREARRFWPNKAIQRIDLEEAVARSCSFLQGNIRAMVQRHPVMMAVTAGIDTRTLLSASKGMQDKIYYFINNENLGYNHPDISVPKKIFKSIGLPFHVHDFPMTVDDEFRRIFLNNTFFASDRILATIYNVYFKQLAERVNILGIGEIGRTRFGKVPRNLNGYRLAYKMGYKEDSYAIWKCQQILDEMVPAYRQFGINVLTGFYWEQFLGNWGSTGNSESDIAIEEVNPYNSHLLYEIFLSVDDKYTKYKKNILFKEMIKRMWPELLEWPINPPHGPRDKLACFLNNVGLFGLFKELKYQFSYLRHGRRARL